MQTVMITGANRGIGLELVRLFAARGDRVVAVCRQSSVELDRMNVRVIEGYVATDPAAPRRVQELLGHERIDLLVNNAGLRTVEELDNLDFARIQTQFIVNAVAPLTLTQALLDRMDSGAKVALITSRVGSLADNGSGGEYGYRMSKTALNMAGVNLAIDLRDRGIAVLLLHPGYVRTGLTGGEGVVDAEQSASMLVALMARLSMADSGRFFHANGQELPW